MSVTLSATPPPVPQPASPSAPPTRPPVQAEPRSLGPAVEVTLGASEPPPSNEPGRFVRDAGSRTLVYQVVDPRTGDITVQIPSEVVLKARSYARATAESEAAPGSQVARRA